MRGLTRKSSEIAFLPTDSLIPHERIRPHHLKELTREILEEGILKTPLIIDRKTRVILDGHHRYRILQMLGAKLIPALLVEYKSPDVSVFPRRIGYKVSKQLVIDTALRGQLMPPKTTRHVLEIELKPVDLPLKFLLNARKGGDLF
ncbi:MAG: transcriptional regulator [Thermoproteota archaeon]|nr:MAG: transcriptional regulator [Candidatus Korarchaeota archaeon]